MNTIQLECFLAVGRHLNFSKAAEEIKITQPDSLSGRGAGSQAFSPYEQKRLPDAGGTAFFPGRGSNPENYRVCQRSAP